MPCKRTVYLPGEYDRSWTQYVAFAAGCWWGSVLTLCWMYIRR